MDASTPLDLLFTGGTVFTGDAQAPTTTALGVAGGRVAALGSKAASAGAREVVDLAGGALLPAFRDGHVHPLGGGVELAEAPIRDCRSVEAVVEAVRRHAVAHPDTEWLRGGGFDPSLRTDGRFDARWLDAAVADRAVVLTTADHHSIWCNTEALRRAGIDATTPDPATGRIDRRADGSPLGTLVEWAAMALVERHLPRRSVTDKQAGLAAANALLAAAGVAWVQEAALSPEDVAVYLAAAETGSLAPRANIALRAEPGRWRQQLPRFVDARAETQGSDAVSVRTVKFFADGVVEHGTAAMLTPYADAGGCGHPVWPPDELAAAVTAMDAAGFQAHIHAIGDAGVRVALDAIAAAAAANGPRDRRPVIAHVQVVHPDDLPRFAALDVIANVEPLWAQLDGVMVDLTLPRLGAERAGWQYPFASLLAAGARLSTGSDWPVSSHRPLDYLPVAVHRQTPSGQPPGGWLPQERLDLATVYAAATRGVAYQAFDDDAGTLRAGMRADLVQLPVDPFALTAEKLPEVEVLGTWVSGRQVHRS
ncbi:MAG: amidohydrolase [Actinomycetota bacterium]|nr:amidohydrolase [Actinomycetota bacterium]